jgi:hypothetical protein
MSVAKSAIATLNKSFVETHDGGFRYAHPPYSATS